MKKLSSFAMIGIALMMSATTQFCRADSLDQKTIAVLPCTSTIPALNVSDISELFGTYLRKANVGKIVMVTGKGSGFKLGVIDKKKLEAIRKSTKASGAWNTWITDAVDPKSPKTMKMTMHCQLIDTSTGEIVWADVVSKNVPKIGGPGGGVQDDETKAAKAMAKQLVQQAVKKLKG